MNEINLFCITCVFSAGAVPTVAKKTHAIIPLVEELQDDRWEAKIVKQDGNRVQLSVNSSPTAVIGRYRLSVVTSGLRGGGHFHT